MISTGDQVPDLALHLSDGRDVPIAPAPGTLRVLYFFPRSNTPGCTTEGGDFSRLLTQFAALHVDVIGVSRDTRKVQEGFVARQGYGFQLASDGDESICNAFDVIAEKTLYGKKSLGIVRSTFVIDPARRVIHAWHPVRVPGHAQAVLDALQAHALQSHAANPANPAPRPTTA